MPRYYFDLRDEDEVAVDEEGLELSSLRAVQIGAAKSLADLARDALHSSFIVPGIRHMAVEVRDRSGPVMHVKCTLDFGISRHD
jgi:hypothetical protein